MALSFLRSKFFRVVLAGICYLIPVELNASVNKDVEDINEELNQDITKKLPTELKLYADKQYDLNEKLFVAEGNVKAYLKGAILKADRLEFDRSRKILRAKGRVTFNKGSQYFQASSLQYDFIEGSGELEDVYGVLDIESLNNDLKIINLGNEFKDKNEIIENMEIKKIKLKDGFNIKGGNIEPKFNSIINNESIQGSINQWRFQSPKINLTKNGWFSKKIIFTNDPLYPTQTKLEALDVIAKEDSNNSTLITFRKSRLILEDKFSIPLLRNRKFGENQNFRWVIGYDKIEKDGLFLGRQYQPIELLSEFKLSLQPQILIQRAITGKTKSYIKSGSSPLSDKVESEINVNDIFGIKANLSGKRNDWELDISSQFTTFDSYRFADGYRYKGTLKKDLNYQDIHASVYTSYRDKTWNGSLGESNIYYSSGAYLSKSGSLKEDKNKHEYDLRIGTGHYEAESFTHKKLIKLWKNNIFTSLRSSYPILRFSREVNTSFSNYRYSPVPIKPGIAFNTKLSTSYSVYSNGIAQALFKISGGPEITLGKFQKKYLDFTRLSIMPGMTIKDGSSPFKFDNDIDLRTITLELEQQIYGPLLLSTGLEYNIDKNSDNYGNSLSSQAAIIIKRRSYGFGLFYQPYQKAGGIMFNLNGFSFNESGTPFDN